MADLWRETRVVGLDRQMCRVRYSPCGRYLVAAGYDARVRRWEVSGDAPVERPALEGHHGWATAVAFGPLEGQLVTADSWGMLAAWDYPAEQPQARWQVPTAHDGWIRDVAVSPDGSLVASVGSDGAVRLWAMADGSLHTTVVPNGPEVFSVAFHPTEPLLIFGDLPGTIRTWNYETKQPGKTLDAKVLFSLSRLQDVGGVRGLVFDPAGAQLAAFGTQPKNGGNVQGVPTVLVFDWSTGQQKHLLALGKEGDVYVTDVHWHYDGYLLAVTSGNPGGGQLLCQPLSDAKPTFVTTKMANCQSLAVHPGGQQLVVAATNKGSNGNGRGDGKEYRGNFAPLHFWENTPEPAKKT